MPFPTIKSGVITGIFGQWLVDYLTGLPDCRDLQVYYDHGDPKKNPNVAVIKGIYDDTVSSMSQLAQVDVLVARPGGEILVLIEIEERPSSPKRIAGDLFALLMCNRFSVRRYGHHQYFEITPQTRLVIAGIMKMKGSKREQLESVILPRIKEFTIPKDAIDPGKVSFLFDENMEEVVDKLKEWFGIFLPKTGL